ncbi:hypothetical protein [Flectobacillus roseus]|uniref:hypothetical protein n=1 Tax=Flectobacillus roseus TaxID=502259 RepID=UPI0024B782C7|nr:hypothetical protein [Flectobacillus roseus]MDI9872629.1 hypothetical protein [Flectobacillus roseus]
MQNLIAKIQKASSVTEMEEVHNEIVAFFQTATEDEKNTIRQAFEEKSKQALKEVNETKNRAEALLRELDSEVILEKDGKRYNLNDWITPSEYAKKYDLKTAQIVSNWITRGIVPPQNVLKIAKLNIQLVKDIRYK